MAVIAYEGLGITTINVMNMDAIAPFLSAAFVVDVAAGLRFCVAAISVMRMLARHSRRIGACAVRAIMLADFWSTGWHRSRQQGQHQRECQSDRK